MAVGSVTKFNEMSKVLLDTDNRDWNDAVAGNIQFILATNAYTPALTHTTTANLSGAITAGDGAPLAATSLDNDSAAEVGSVYLDSDPANFGANVTITAKYLIATLPVAANTYDNSTNKLLWYVDLDDTSTSTSKSSTNADFSITAPTNGWVKFT